MRKDRRRYLLLIGVWGALALSSNKVISGAGAAANRPFKESLKVWHPTFIGEDLPGLCLMLSELNGLPFVKCQNLFSKLEKLICKKFCNT
ncbi:unnamed protein product [Linum trigynum]|uniref:Secreted protein n=1 Tax=Linum trigynum TaxID=586398 RepID=A0AAV2FDA2_9ROSI